MNALLPACLLAAAASATAAERLLIDAGPHARRNCPVTIALPADSPWAKDAAGGAALAAVDGDTKIPAAVLPSMSGCELLVVLPDLPAGHSRRFSLAREKAESPHAVAFKREDARIAVALGGRPLTSYDPAVAPMKQIWPVLHPLFGPGGAMLTRAFPLDGPPADTNDHPHHQAVWTAHGNVNGVNFWHLAEGHGIVKQREVHAACAPAAGRIRALLDWCDAAGKKILDEERVITFWATPDIARIIDFDATFRATEGDVTFGDTKEGGLLAVRLADSMREKQKGDAPPGTITIATGATGEKDAWGKPADWCDYSGPIGSATAGIATMAHPANAIHPTYWHVRSYGLMTANPFGLSDFTKDKSKNGGRTLKKGDSWRMRFRLFAHASGAAEAGVAGAWLDYAQPPAATVK